MSALFGNASGSNSMRLLKGLLFGTALVTGALLSIDVAAQLTDAPIRHDSGQSITPSFEGWFKNPDGTFSLSFGYMNRNYKEEVDLPVGPNNKFEPGPADQGQPTHFMPRRNTGVFTVVVPADFGKQQLSWTIAAHGQTITIPGHLRPEWNIDAQKEITNGNTPPLLKFAAADKGGQGPGGVRTAMAVTTPGPVELPVFVTDDGVAKRQGDTDDPDDRPRGPTLGVNWSQYRGPGPVTFTDRTPKIVGGRATTSVTFEKPGDYVLRVLAWDVSGAPGLVMATGFQCCWTNGYVNVSVSPAAVTPSR
jgi:hypothetical protein